VLRCGAPLSHAYIGPTVHHNSPVTPWLPRDPFDNIVAIASDLQSQIVALDSARASTSTDQDLNKHITAANERQKVFASSAIDLILGQR